MDQESYALRPESQYQTVFSSSRGPRKFGENLRRKHTIRFGATRLAYRYAWPIGNFDRSNGAGRCSDRLAPGSPPTAAAAAMQAKPAGASGSRVSPRRAPACLTREKCAFV